MVSFSVLFPGRDVIFTDSTASVILHAPQTNSPHLKPQELQYTVFPDARNPVRLVIASLLCRKLERGSYFWLPSVDEVFTVPSGALNHPDKRRILEGDAMRLWSQKNDIDWYTACNDADYRAVVSSWMRNMLEAFQGKDFLSSGDVLQVQPSAFHHQLKPLFDKESLPPDTSTYIKEIRRNTDDHAFRTKLSQMDSFEIRILGEVDSSDIMDGSSFACEVFAATNVPWARKTKFRVKMFDDRRIGNPEILKIGPGDSQWFFHAKWTHGDVLAALEDAAYRRLDHTQGSILPYYYGAHKVNFVWALFLSIIIQKIRCFCLGSSAGRCPVLGNFD